MADEKYEISELRSHAESQTAEITSLKVQLKQAQLDAEKYKLEANRSLQEEDKFAMFTGLMDTLTETFEEEKRFESLGALFR